MNRADVLIFHIEITQFECKQEIKRGMRSNLIAFSGVLQ